MKRVVVFAFALAATPATADVWVDPHFRDDGTFVEGHWRTNPNNNPWDNYSTKGNVNPYNGQRGTVAPPPPALVLPPPPPPVPIPNFNSLISPADIGRSVSDSFYRGMMMRQQIEQQRAAARYYEQQRAMNNPPPPPDYDISYGEMSDPPETITPQETFVAPIETRRAIGDMIREGNCPGAINSALSAGDIELAANVRAFCNGAVVTPTP